VIKGYKNSEDRTVPPDFVYHNGGYTLRISHRQRSGVLVQLNHDRKESAAIVLELPLELPADEAIRLKDWFWQHSGLFY